MVNLKLMVKGMISFPVGVLYMLVLTYVIIPIIDVGNSILTTTNEVEAIAWLLALVFYLFVVIILPSNWLYLGITEQGTYQDNKGGILPDNKFMLTIIALMLFLIGMLMTVKGWYMITAMHNSILDAGFGDTTTVVISAFYWVGLILSWLLTVVIAPVAIITTAYQQNQEL